MKKTKYFLVSIMAIVLCLMCLMTTTFSWFTRPADSGGMLEWKNSESGLNYKTSDGKDISMVTYELSEDGKSSAQDPVTSFSNSTGIASGHRKYYRTDITNSGDADQSVSLYMSGLDVTQGNLHIGVNNPLKTYKEYSGATNAPSTRVAKSINRQNIYVGLHKDEIDDLISKIDYIHTYNGSNYETVELSSKNDTGSKASYYPDDFPDGSKKWNGEQQQFKMYVMTVSSSRETFMLKAHSGTNGSGGDGWYETPKATISSNQLLTFYQYGGTYYLEQEYSNPAAKLLTFYSEATVYSGKTVEIPATGHSITYKSSNEDIATVSSNGTVTGKKAGTVKITATSTGIYGDTLESECVVTVKETDDGDIPIVTNYLVPAKKDGNDTTVSVYWYINNEGTEALKYEIADVYLSL